MGEKATRKVKMPFSGKKIEFVKNDGISFTGRDGLRCGNCNKSESELQLALKCCSRCKIALYCSKECQLEDYKNRHKVLCLKTVSVKSGAKVDVCCDKIKIANVRLQIGIRSRNVAGLKLAHEELFDALHFCVDPDTNVRFIPFVYSMKTILYLYVEDFERAGTT